MKNNIPNFNNLSIEQKLQTEAPAHAHFEKMGPIGSTVFTKMRGPKNIRKLKKKSQLDQKRRGKFIQNASNSKWLNHILWRTL